MRKQAQATHNAAGREAPDEFPLVRIGRGADMNVSDNALLQSAIMLEDALQTKIISDVASATVLGKSTSCVAGGSVIRESALLQEGILLCVRPAPYKCDKRSHTNGNSVDSLKETHR